MTNTGEPDPQPTEERALSRRERWRHLAEERRQALQEIKLKNREMMARANTNVADAKLELEEAKTALREQNAERPLFQKAAKARASMFIIAKDSVTITYDGDRELKITRGFKKKHYVIDNTVSATVDTAGNLATRSMLTRAAVGTVLLPGIGTLLGMSAQKTIDKRELYLLIEAQDWAEAIELKPKSGAQARTLAQKINLAARRS